MPINTNVTPLKCENLKKVISVEYHDLERYIREITGKTLYIQAILECGNDTVHKFDVGDHPERLYEEDKKDMESFLFGDAKDIPTYQLGDLLNTMCIHGLLKKGTYIIDVCY